jgi:outer membrane immunogenic protein
LPYSNSPKGGLLGARVGYNWQKSNFVFGLEGDANAVIGAKGSSYLPSPPTSYVVQSKQAWTSDVRARLGYAIDKTLLYAAAGAAFGDVHTTYGGAGYAPPGGVPFSVTTQRVGWTVGAGAEYAFSDKIVGSLDYRYTDLGSRSFSNSNPLIDTADKVKFHANTVLVGLAYRF